MKQEFKPDDFKDLSDNDYIHYSNLTEISHIANELLPEIKEAWKAEMLKDAVVVYGVNGGTGWNTELNKSYHTHKALIYNSEPIVKEPCKHRPPKNYHSTDRIFCECGVELVAEWKAKSN